MRIGRTSPLTPVVVLCVVLATAVASGGPREMDLPNLKPLPAEELLIAPADRGSGVDTALRFGVTTMNLGDYALELLGLPKGEDRFDAWQCTRWAARACLLRSKAGEIVFHADHNHWHYDNFAVYELRRLVDGQVDMSPEGLVVEGVKASFCLQDSGTADESRREFPPSPRVYWGLCQGVFQGISPQWQDSYGPSLPGQQIVLRSVPDGTYALVVTIDPLGLLYETTRADNVSVRLLELSRDGSSVRGL